MNTALQLDKEQFLAEYWQRRHLLINNAVADFQPPLSADELGGLAMEDAIESRIVEEVKGNWKLHHGPFSEADFNRSTPWTLLVQAVDYYMPAVAALRQLVDFIPQWRVDDVMISYAENGGSVGPHYDNYDVFLLQGEGQREWRIGQRCDDSTALLDNPDLRLLADFQCQETYLLNPGDILYVPPGVAHWGIARGDCTTFSIGFRAPRINSLLSRWVDETLEALPQDLFYSDPPRSGKLRPGEIDTAARERALQLMLQTLQSSDSRRWFGEVATEPRYEPANDAEAIEDAIVRLTSSARRVEILPEAKVAWQEEEHSILLFANGLSGQFHKSALPLIENLCQSWCMEGQALVDVLADEASKSVLQYLIHCECLYVE